MRYRSRALVNGAAAAGLFFAVTVIVSGFIPNPVFDRYVPRSGTDVFFALSTAVLLGGYTVQQCTRVDCSWGPDAVFGGFGGYLAVSCPHCIPGVEAVLATGTIDAYLVPVRPIVGVFAIGLLAGAITVRQRRLVTEGPAVPEVDLRCPTCGVVLRESTDDPEPEFDEGRMRMDVQCGSCDDGLVVTVEPSLEDSVDVRKRVTREADASDPREGLSPYSILPSEDRNQDE